MTANETQWHNWTQLAGPQWVAHEAIQEMALTPIAQVLLAAAAARKGDQVIEIGCGTGTLLGRLCAAVGRKGAVTGADFSPVMLAQARRRAPRSARLMQVDAQTDALEGPYDLAVSRFGVMFFADPVAAFANIRAALRPGGRLVFACWSALADNPHWAAAMDRAVARVGPPTPSDPWAPGPMAFADPQRVQDILAAAGFRDIGCHTERVRMAYASAADYAAQSVVLGPAAALLREREASAAVRAAIEAELRAGYTAAYAGVHLVRAAA